MKTLKFWQIDAFTKNAFTGNPAAVVISEDKVSDDLMQSIAKEMNLSETAFIQLQPNKNPILQWFTPNSEIDLCGHATLASAHVLFTEFFHNAKSIVFDTKFVGTLKVFKNEYGITMDFPKRAGEQIDVKSIPPHILDALSPNLPIEAYQARDLMLVYENEEMVRSIKVDFNMLAAFDGTVIATSISSSPEFDCVSRVFSASDGTLEDPVTGSSHCTIAPYWAGKLNKTHLTAYQASKRGGILKLELINDRVLISGDAITVIKGEIRL